MYDAMLVFYSENKCSGVMNVKHCILHVSQYGFPSVGDRLCPSCYRQSGKETSTHQQSSKIHHQTELTHRYFPARETTCLIRCDKWSRLFPRGWQATCCLCIFQVVPGFAGITYALVEASISLYISSCPYIYAYVYTWLSWDTAPTFLAGQISAWVTH